MKKGRVFDGEDACIVDEALRAETVLERMRGLLGYQSLEKNQGIWLEPCASIHTCFMKFTLDIVFVDANGRIRKVIENLSPWRFAFCLRASATLELPAGRLAKLNLQKGQFLNWQEVL